MFHLFVFFSFVYILAFLLFALLHFSSFFISVPCFIFRFFVLFCACRVFSCVFMFCSVVQIGRGKIGGVFVVSMLVPATPLCFLFLFVSWTQTPS